MVSRLVPSSALAAIAGAAMFVAASSSPSPAFTLSSPALVVRVAQNWGYSLLSLTRASLVVNCQSALA